MMFSQIISYVELGNLLFLVRLSSEGTKSSFLGNMLLFCLLPQGLVGIVWIKWEKSLENSIFSAADREKAGNTQKQ